MAIIEFDDLVACLRVEQVAEGRFTARNVPMAYRRVFGGQLLAQCVAVAAATTPGKQLKSLHATFPREGDLALPIDYRVERIHDGRSFAGRVVVGEQPGRSIVAASVSLHVVEPGPEHMAAPREGPGPDDAVPAELGMIPWETRIVDGVDLADRAPGPPRFAFWMRAPTLGDDPVVHHALLAHATDLTVIGTVLRPFEDLGEGDAPDRIQTAVTSHTIWLHTDFRVDDWLLVQQESPRAGGARGFGLGHVFTKAGALVASFAQESLIRPVTSGP